MSRLWEKNEARLSPDTRLYLLSFEPCDGLPYEHNLNCTQFRRQNKYRAYNGETTETVKYPWVYKFSQENALKYDQ